MHTREVELVCIYEVSLLLRTHLLLVVKLKNSKGF